MMRFIVFWEALTMLPTLYLHKTYCLALGLVIGISGVSPIAMAEDSSLPSTVSVMQVARYSVIRPGPTPGQQDLLAVSLPRQVPNEIATVGGALEWVIKDSGYRLADSDRLTSDVKALMNLPLPNAHRRFQALPLKAVIALLAGPAFVLVHDPVHRLLAFEHCRHSTQRPDAHQSTQESPTKKGGR